MLTSHHHPSCQLKSSLLHKALQAGCSLSLSEFQRLWSMPVWSFVLPCGAPVVFHSLGWKGQCLVMLLLFLLTRPVVQTVVGAQVLLRPYLHPLTCSSC